MKILANDGLDQSGIDALVNRGFEVITDKVPQNELIQYINQHEISTLLVRSATEVRKDLIDACPSLQIIGRGGVGMDNIDVTYAREKGLQVINTPAASSASVAELVFGHLFTGVRFLHDANRKMPLTGATEFGVLKKKYAKGTELRGKTLGIVGLGRIGQEVARIAAGLGMKVIATDNFVSNVTIALEIFDGQQIDVTIPQASFEEVLAVSDFVTLHVPAQNGYLIGSAQLDSMKTGAAIVNCSRGGIVDEKALIVALDSGKISFAALDVFLNEPTPDTAILAHDKISLTPHIGASTIEAQDRIGLSLADQITAILQVEV